MRYVAHVVLPSLLLLSLSVGTAAGQTPVYGYEIIKQYPHDTSAFTEGLVLTSGALYESTGLYGSSNLRQVDLQTGALLKKADIESAYFGEGITTFQGKIFYLTFQSQTAFVYDQATFARIGQFFYTGEGWGLTHDDRYLIMSDGTNQVRFLDPVTFQPVRSINVSDDQGAPVANLNELEYINGEIFANVWPTDWVVRIDPVSGKVRGWIDFTGLLPAGTFVDVLNGIAYDQASGHLLVTGKYWPSLFEVRLLGPAAVSPDGTTVPTATRIVDNAGGVWTIGVNHVIVRNGVQAASGFGSQILWKGGAIYVLGTDSNWWQWTGSGWINVGSAMPGGGGGSLPSAAATFVGTDTTTRGAWRGVYGTQGYALVNDGISLPAGASVTPRGHSSWTWASSSTEARALQKAAAADRIAATWYSSTAFTIDVNAGDTQAHRVGVYLLDWDTGGGRAETLEILDSATGVVLDTQIATGFNGGQFWVWRVTGAVGIRVTNAGGLNAVLSAVFLDPGTPAASTVTFIGTDTTTRGTWKGVYGTQGYALVNDATSLPAGATVTASGQSSWTWAASSADVRALQKSAASSRIAATWYSSTAFSIDVNAGDMQAHRVSVYILDWEGANRAETFEILDSVSGAVLDTRIATGFSGGQYWVWGISRPVRFRVTRTGGVNAVVGAVFLDPP